MYVFCFKVYEFLSGLHLCFKGGIRIILVMYVYRSKVSPLIISFFLQLLFVFRNFREVKVDNEGPKKSNRKRGNRGKRPLDGLSGNLLVTFTVAFSSRFRRCFRVSVESESNSSDLFSFVGPA